MKLPSKFQWVLIRIAVIILLLVIIQFINIENTMLKPFYVPMYFIPLLLLMYTIFTINDFTTECIALKYKILSDSGYVGVKYLTIKYIIPMWCYVESNTHSSDTTNLFGGKMTAYWKTEIYFKNEDEAKEAIIKHKKRIKDNRYKWFKRDYSQKKVEYFN